MSKNRQARSSIEKEQSESTPEENEAAQNSTMMSYAFKSFSPREGGPVKQGRNLRTCTSNLLRRLEELQQLALGANESQTLKKGTDNDASDEQPNVVSEHAIKNWVGKSTYSLGLKYFALGLVTERRSERNVLHGSVVEGKSHSEYVARVEFKRGSGEPSYHQLSAWCDCLESAVKEKKVCAHIAALLIAWSRESESFESKPLNASALAEGNRRFLSDLARTTDRVFSALEEMISFILGEKNCQEVEVLDMLQMLYSSTKIASTKIADRWNELSSNTHKEQYEMVLGFSFISSVIISRVLTAIDVKYKIGAMKMKSKADVNVIRAIIEKFAQKPKPNTPFPKKAVSAFPNRTVQKNTPDESINTTGRKDGQIVSRSWDKIVAEFANG